MLGPTHPNQGIEAEYRRRLNKLIDDMNASLIYWITAAYRANTPELALDASPAAALGYRIRQLTRQWQRRFDRIAPDLAKWFAQATKDRTDYSLKQALKRGGMTVEFKMSPGVNDVFQATVGENVGLIKSIAAEHLADVQQLVMRSVASGRDLHHVRAAIQARYGVTKRRAALISRDQSNKATAVITRARQAEMGCTEAIWVHSGGGRHPRPEHLKAGRDGLRYDISKGAFLEGEWVWPGTAINCRCVSRTLIRGVND